MLPQGLRRSIRTFLSFFALVILAAFFVVVTLYHQTRVPALSEVHIRLPRLSAAMDGMTILHLSDLHGARFGPDQEGLLRLVAGRQVDLVVITGDLAGVGGDDFDAATSLIRGLREDLQATPILVVSGESDLGSLDVRGLRRLLMSEGAALMENGAMEFFFRGGSFWVIGVGDPVSGRDDLQRALLGVEEDRVMILLAHSPAILDEAAAAGIDLVLAGHTHGGQVRLPGIAAVWPPGERLFPRDSIGLSRRGETQLYVNRGLGTTGVPFRFFSRPEVAVITLRSGGK